MRSRLRTESGPHDDGEGRIDELLRLRRTQRVAGDEGYRVKARSRRRGGRGRRRGRSSPPPPPPRRGFLAWLGALFGGGPGAPERDAGRRHVGLDRQEERVLAEFSKQYGLTFHDPGLLKLALTHRSYLSVTGQGPRESNERLEFLGDSVLGLVTSEFLYRRHPDEHEGQLTKTKSLLVSKAILSRRALRMGLGRYVLMSHSEIESGGRQRLSILADAFEAVLGAIYLDQGFETARTFVHNHLLADSDEIVADKRHTNYKSHLQEYVQSTYRTHPVYRIRSEYGPDHSKHFMVEVMVGRRTLGEGRGPNKKEAEQAAARDALESVKRMPAENEPGTDEDDALPSRPEVAEEARGESRRRRRRRGGRSRSGTVVEAEAAPRPAPDAAEPEGDIEEYEAFEDELVDAESDEATAEGDADSEREVPGESESAREELHVDPYGHDPGANPGEAAEADVDEESNAREHTRRIDEIERAMESFGQRGAAFGRRGRPARRGR